MQALGSGPHGCCWGLQRRLLLAHPLPRALRFPLTTGWLELSPGLWSMRLALKGFDTETSKDSKDVNGKSHRGTAKLTSFQTSSKASIQLKREIGSEMPGHWQTWDRGWQACPG